MGRMEESGGHTHSRMEEALKLFDAGLTQAAAAKECGITRQAVADALKRRAARQAQAEQPRVCSECGNLLPPEARASASTCSTKCRTFKSRRLKKEKAAERIER